MSQWAEAEIGFAQLPAVRRAELLLERFFVREEAARTVQRAWLTHLLATGQLSSGDPKAPLSYHLTILLAHSLTRFLLPLLLSYALMLLLSYDLMTL